MRNRNKFNKYIRLLRINNYIKNFLVLFPLFFHEQMTEWDLLVRSLMGVLAFSVLSSAIYIVNDIADREKDRLHPTKKNRPIASGEISVKNAIGLAGMCLMAAIFTGVWIDCTGESYGTVYLAIYGALNLCYSKGMKNVPLIDVAILSSGFLLRVIYGANITHIQISYWLYLTIIAGALFMGLGKRRNEIGKSKSGGVLTRKVLAFYTYEFLDKNMYVCLAMTDIFYSLWAIEKGNRVLLSSIPIFIFLMMKYSLNIEGDSEGNPVDVILKDRAFLVIAGIFGMLMVSAFYF